LESSKRTRKRDSQARGQKEENLVGAARGGAGKERKTEYPAVQKGRLENSPALKHRPRSPSGREKREKTDYLT